MKWDYKACLHYGFGLNPDQAKTRFTQVTRVCTRPRLMRVPSMSTARIMLKSDGTSAYWQCMSSFDHSSMVQRSRTSETLVHVAVFWLAQFRPTFNPHTYTYVGEPGFNPDSQNRVKCGCAQTEFNPGSRISADMHVEKWTCLPIFSAFEPMSNSAVLF